LSLTSGALRRLLTVVCPALPIAVLAQLAPSLQRSIDWLGKQVRSSEVAGEDHAVATPKQARAETVQTLQLLATLPGELAATVAAGNDGDEDTEVLARRVIAGGVLGIDAAPLLTRLLERQNPDGGFGAAPARGSFALDTAWALVAIGQVGGRGGFGPCTARPELARSPGGR